MQIGDLVRLHSSTRRCGQYAGKMALVIGKDGWKLLQYVLMVDGDIKTFHSTQIESVDNESW